MPIKILLLLGKYIAVIKTVCVCPLSLIELRYWIQTEAHVVECED